MVLLGKSWTLKIFMILCISLQCIALFPHHHHADKGAVCFNIEHCITSHSDFKDHEGCTHNVNCNEHSMQRHNHDSEHSSCVATKIVVIKPQNESVSALLPFAFLLIDNSIPSMVPSMVCDDNYTNTMLVRNVEQHVPYVESIFVTYITSALSMRAPNVLS